MSTAEPLDESEPGTEPAPSVTVHYCAVASCGRPTGKSGRRPSASGLCQMHLKRKERTGDPEGLTRHPVAVVPDMPRFLVAESVTDLAAGTAAEHLVCADLLLAGYRAFLADQNCPYDIAVEVDGRLIRIQVKSTRRYKAVPQRVVHTPGYLFHVGRAGKKGQRRYAETEFDVLALVALDLRLIRYLAGPRTIRTIIFTPPGASSGRQFGDYPVARAFAEVSK